MLTSLNSVLEVEIVAPMPSFTTSWKLLCSNIIYNIYLLLMPPPPWVFFIIFPVRIMFSDWNCRQRLYIYTCSYECSSWYHRKEVLCSIAATELIKSTCCIFFYSFRIQTSYAVLYYSFVGNFSRLISVGWIKTKLIYGSREMYAKNHWLFLSFPVLHL